MDSKTCAELLGVKKRRFRSYYTELGMPSNRSGRERTFDWPAVLEWYIEYRVATEYGESGPATQAGEDEEPATGKKEDITKATLRKTRAEADLKELALSRQRGQVVVIGDAKE